MKKINLSLALAALFLTGMSCGAKKDAKSVAQKWCDLTAKVYKAPEGAEKLEAEKKANEYQAEIAKKYADDPAFLKEVENEAEKCEDEAEGRK